MRSKQDSNRIQAKNSDVTSFKHQKPGTTSFAIGTVQVLVEHTQ